MAAVDVTGPVSDIAGTAGSVAALGVAVLLMLVMLKGFYWIRVWLLEEPERDPNGFDPDTD